jgi:hypothetical protein
MNRLLLLLVMLTLGLASCDDDDNPVIENEEEVITEFIYTLTPAGGGAEILMVFNDPDGDGGIDPVIQVTGPLQSSTTYSGSLALANRTNPNTSVDIGAEVLEEDEDHQFFYLVEDGLDLDIAYADSDGDGNPLGLLTELTTADSSSTGNLRVILRHEPNKTAANVTIGDPSGAGGTTDLEVTFPVSVEN